MQISIQVDNSEVNKALASRPAWARGLKLHVKRGFEGQTTRRLPRIPLTSSYPVLLSSVSRVPEA